MVVEDKGIVISVRKFQENKYIVKCLLRESGLISGLYRNGGRYCQEPICGSLAHVKWQGRLPDQLGVINIDTVKSPIHIAKNSKIHILSLNSSLSLINTLLLEKDPQPRLFDALTHLIEYISTSPDDLLTASKYIMFEIYEILQLFGYGLDLSKCVVTGKSEGLTYVSPKSAAAVSDEAGAPYHDKLFKLPHFLISSALPSYEDIREAFKLSFYFLDKNLIGPYSKKMPVARKMLQDAIYHFTKAN